MQALTTTATHLSSTVAMSSTWEPELSRIEGHLIYETQAEHDQRIDAENRRFHWNKKRSRNRPKTRQIRDFIYDRADSKCEICRFDLSSILVIHHIMPVALGGSAQVFNLILLCPNCHGLVHNYRHHRRSQQRSYPAWIGRLCKTGLKKEQAERLLLIASKEARVCHDGSIEHYKESDPLVSIIVDDNGNPIHPRHDPAVLDRALSRIESIFGLAGVKDDDGDTRSLN